MNVNPAQPRRTRHLLTCLCWLTFATIAWSQLIGTAGARTGPTAETAQGLPGLELGFNDPALLADFGPADVAVGLAHARDAGASVWRIQQSWSSVSPNKPPSLAVAADPNWSGYDWATIDANVREIAAAGMVPLIALQDAPKWAEGPDRPSTSAAPAGTWRPSTKWFGAFATALATRYSGTFVDLAESPQPLPAVPDWEAWNEPNLAVFLTPQWTSSRKPASPSIYRALLNAFYHGVKKAAPDDVIAAGTTAPFGDPPGGQRMRPVLFWRDLLCLTEGAHPRSTHCHQHVYMDAISHHPYPLGPPTTHAADPGDITVPDLGEITSLIPIAERAGTVLPKGPKPLWVTELSWDTNPPNPNGLSPALQAEYLEGALYVLWKEGASLVTWWNVRDDVPSPGWVNTLASGIYYAGATPSQDVPKPSYTAYTFPFTAYRSKGVAHLWGMAPTAGPVAIQVENGTTWATVTTLQAGQNRVFSGTLLVGIGTNLRAVSDTTTSLTWTTF